MKKMISRRNFLAAAGVVAAAGVLTACGGSSNSTAASASTAASGAAASGDTIKVGVLGPLTGDVSVYGQAVVNGATLYLKQVNEKGGINGKQLEIITMDEQGDATQAVTCFTKMCDQGITALVGDVTTTPTLALAAESADYNMPMVTASATAEAVTYDAKANSLQPIAKGDHRAAVAGSQDFVKSAPVSLVLVSDLSRFGNIADHTKLMAAVDAGIVCQNINIFCAATGLATVPRATMDQAALKRILKLTDSQLPIMNNPVGYPRE